ncbi:MAG: zeta toxin family protein [Paludibacteraceae bacterium]|nr:zeta toxin family protein [Paludibacteraceae bacterium]
MRKPVLIVIAGPNGSGKTSTTHLVIKHEWAEQCVYINPDEIAQSKFGNWNDVHAVRQAVEYCDTWREQLLQERKDFIFETVLSSDGKVDFLKRAKEAGYFIRVFFICTESPTINAARIANRVMEGGHDVPIQKIISRYQKAIINAVKVTEFADRVYFYDNSVDNQDAQILFRTTDGKFAKQYVESFPVWTRDILDSVKK